MAQVSGPQWAADPYGRYELRFWDGSVWTEHVSRHGVQARDPLAPAAPVAPQQTFAQQTLPQQTFGQEPFAELLPRSSERAAGAPAHTRQGSGAVKAPRRKGLPLLLAAGGVAAVVALAASLGGGPSTPTASTTTDSIQPLAAVPTQSSSTKAKAATTTRTTTTTTTTSTKAAAAKKATTTKATTTGSRTTTTPAKAKTRTSSTKPRTTSTKPKPRTTTSTKPAAKRYKNCTALNAVYPHGVGRSGAVDETSGTPVTTFRRDNALYAANAGSDRDKDEIACEKR